MLTLTRFACALSLLGLAASVRAGALIDVGTGEGSNNWDYVHNFPSLTLKETFAPYTPSYTGGVRVAVGDVNNDGVVDYITGAGTVSHVIAFSGVDKTQLKSFLAYTPLAAPFGVYVGAGDINKDGYADIITGPGGEGPLVRAFDGQTGAMTRNFLAYGSGFTGGVRVAAGDIDGDGFADIITGAGTAGAGHVKAFSGQTGAEIRSFLAYGAGYTGGVFVAAGDVNGDGLADIITGADEGFGPHVKVFDAVTNAEIRSFFAYGATFLGGVRVAAGDLNGDGQAEIITGAGPGGAPHVKAFDGATNAEIASFLTGTAGDPNGVYVAGAGVPEPGTLGLLGASSLLVLGRRRGR